MLNYRQSSPSNSSSSSSNSPLFPSHPNWSDQSLHLPTSLPVRSPKIRSSNKRRFLLVLVLSIISLSVLFRRKLPKSPSGGDIYEHIKDQISSFQTPERDPLDPIASCRLDMSTLKDFELTPEITYARRYIQQKPFERGRNPRAGLSWVDEMKKGIFTGLDYLDTSKDGIVDLRQCTPKPLPMYMRHQDKPTDAKHLVFGLATTAERLLDAAPTMSHWLSNTNANLIAIIPTGPQVSEVRRTMRRLGIKATILTSNEVFLINYFKLIEAFSVHSDSRAKWFTFIDDDTHYFSLQRYADILSTYDHKQEHYLGSVSEDLRQIRGDGIFAFGGAGITVSRSLLEKLHQNYYVCLGEQAPWEPGDVRLKRCIYQHTETKLTMVEGLHQVDLLGETNGVLEGPRPPINWHHYKSWSRQNVSLISSAGQICGGACLFQRWKFPVPTEFGYTFMTLHHGVSIIGYSVGIRPDLSRTELTWANLPESNFDHSVAPLRMGLTEGRDRFTYRLAGVGRDVDGHVKHTYIKYAEKELEYIKDEERRKEEDAKREAERKKEEEEAEKAKAKAHEDEIVAKAKELIASQGAASLVESDAETKGAASTKEGDIVGLASDAAIEAAAKDSKDATPDAAKEAPVVVVEAHKKRSTATRIDEVLELIFL